jgi:hypothetical protein
LGSSSALIIRLIFIPFFPVSFFRESTTPFSTPPLPRPGVILFEATQSKVWPRFELPVTRERAHICDHIRKLPHRDARLVACGFASRRHRRGEKSHDARGRQHDEGEHQDERDGLAAGGAALLT